MSILEKTYLMYYFLVKKDKNSTKQSRTLVIIETVINMLTASMYFYIVGFLNIRLNTVLKALLFGALSMLTAHIITQFLYSKNGRDSAIIIKGKGYSKSDRRVLMMIGILSFFVIFTFMFFSATMMSYLWSLNSN